MIVGCTSNNLLPLFFSPLTTFIDLHTEWAIIMSYTIIHDRNELWSYSKNNNKYDNNDNDNNNNNNNNDNDKDDINNDNDNNYMRSLEVTRGQ